MTALLVINALYNSLQHVNDPDPTAGNVLQTACSRSIECSSSEYSTFFLSRYFFLLAFRDGMAVGHRDPEIGVSAENPQLSIKGVVFLS